MKYIRTKNGIFELANERTITEFQVIDHLHNRAFLKDDILAQADTIEELCDEFVIKHIKYEKPFVADDYRILEDRQKAFEYGVEVVYGAIYTSKGLIYVAKMNDEGKLVLM